MSQNLVSQDNQQQEKLSCLMIPLNDKNILLPNVTVAEIITYRQIIKSEYRSDWLMGQLQWRDTIVPVVSYEIMNGSTVNITPESRIAIINGVGAHKQMPFFAIVIQGIPRLVQLTEHDVQEVEAMHSGHYDQMMVSLNNQQIAIPNLELIEAELLNYIG